MTKKEQQQIYVSPYMATMDIETQAVICQSGGIGNMTIDTDEGNVFEIN